MIVKMNESLARSEVNVGLKARNLARVKEAGINVPFTIIIPSEDISDLLSKYGIRHKVFMLSRALLDEEVPDKVRELEKDLKSSILSLIIPEELVNEILDSISGNIGRISVARPSPYAPELRDGDLKGRMSVWYDEPTRKGIIRSIQRVISGVFSLRSMARLLDLGIYPEDIDLAIIFQKAIFPRSSGLAICCPARRKNEILVESTWGIMDSTPRDRFRISIDLVDIVESELSEKKTKLVPSTQGLREIEVPHDLWMEPSLKGEEAKNIARISSELSLTLGTPTLMEWIIQEGSNSLFVIQAHRESERPPIKTIEKKVLRLLEEKVGYEEISKRPEVKEKSIENVVGVPQIGPIASKIFVRLEEMARIENVDGYLINIDKLREDLLEDNKIYLVLVPPEWKGQVNITGERARLKILIDIPDLRGARERALQLYSLFPSHGLVIYLRDAGSVLLSESLSEFFEGAVLDIGNILEFGGEDAVKASITFSSSYFDYVIADLADIGIKADIIERLIDGGADGFCIDEGRVSRLLSEVSRAEMRYLLRKVRELDYYLRTLQEGSEEEG